MQISLFKITDAIVKKQNLNKREQLYYQYLNKLSINPILTRCLVSFQENKRVPFYRWLKFKEGFSSQLVRYLINHYKNKNKIKKKLKILDPFAGSGTTLTTAIETGNFGTGIELLPVGTSAIKARLMADSVDIEEFKYYLKKFEKFSNEPYVKSNYQFPHLRITEKAFPPSTEDAISSFISFLNTIDSEDVKYLFWFVSLSVLEDVSYTSKDGQYLRWDYRSGRSLKSKNKKNKILDFKQAIIDKLQIVLFDLYRRNGATFTKNVKIIEGSCLYELPLFPANSFDLVITSPPYCNRYDYTRTYALELAYLGYDENKVKNLRQELLSATVENKTKKEQIKQKYLEINKFSFFNNIVDSFNNQEALNEVLNLLNNARNRGLLNNNNIPNMVENYFFEINVVIHELSRILSPNGRIYMVNDNVQYIGEEVPVDLILSNFAETAGLKVDAIWILSKGKGNSSQQMGEFGRKELRKCIYVWSKISH